MQFTLTNAFDSKVLNSIAQWLAIGNTFTDMTYLGLLVVEKNDLQTDRVGDLIKQSTVTAEPRIKIGSRSASSDL